MQVIDSEGYLKVKLIGGPAGPFVPYTGATANVDLGTHTLSSKDLIVNHSSGSGVAASITKGGSGEALTVVKSSGSGNAASITGGVTVLSDLHLGTPLTDSYISSSSAWNNKQDALVSATNIKTINGSSVLGSGNLTVSGSVSANYPLTVFGTTVSIPLADEFTDGYLSSGDWSYFDAKQPALISGGNIKTINGNSIVGSGNLVVGGGGGGINAQIPLGSGGVYSNIPTGSSNSTQVITANTIYLMPFIPNVTFTTSNIFLNVTVFGVGVSARILLYSHSATNGLPDTKLFESANLDCSTSGVKTATTTQTFTAGTPYWLGLYGNGNATFAGVAIASLMQIGMDSSSTQWLNISRSVTFGSAPTSWGTTHTKTNTTFTRIGLTQS